MVPFSDMGLGGIIWVFSVSWVVKLLTNFRSIPVISGQVKIRPSPNFNVVQHIKDIHRRLHKRTQEIPVKVFYIPRWWFLQIPGRSYVRYICTYNVRSYIEKWLMRCGKFFQRLQTTVRVHCTPRPTSSSACLVLPYNYVLRIHFRRVLNFPLNRTKNLL